ncbi:hypothetical protein [Alloactinosynnema sp. L-07]|uniref:hypothetical protein n=1 Tax=Alloactinosynnema sp. L-07 TaxID=1653480 RepID=UPI00065EF486|nr:hypothetical protein [Alloactinosynnema sp. L-07]CRK60194.1 hypothetical protein [Alloactinosynnema sp. L-07]
MSTPGPYPSYPDGPFEPPRAAPNRPPSVDRSFQLWLANGVLGLIGFILVLTVGKDTFRDEVVKTLREGGTAYTDADIDAALTIGLAFAGIVAAIFFGLYLLFAFKMRAGRNWARVVLAVLGGLALLLNIIGLAGGGNMIETIVTIVQIALIGGAVYYMFTKESAEYFDAVKRHP